MNRVVWCVLLGAMGCFDPSTPAGGDAAGADGPLGSDGASPTPDGRARTDANGDAPDAPPRDVDCVDGTLCSVLTAFDAPEPGWTQGMTGTCTVQVSGGMTRIATAGNCTTGVRCELRTPERPMGTGRVVTRTIELAPEINGDLWFEVVDRSHDGPRVYYRPGVAQAVIADGTSESDAGTVTRGDVATWGIRLDDDDIAHFERWDGSSWVEFGSGDAPWTTSENVTMALGLTCHGATGDPIVGEWGPVGGLP